MNYTLLLLLTIKDINWPNVLNRINLIICIAFLVIYFMQNLHLVISIFTKYKRYPKAKKLHKFGYLISARNEGAVIGNLIDSIFEQDYPKDLIKVFVVADNCTDNTAEVAKSHGAIVYEHTDNVRKGKCYALDFLIKKVLADENYQDLECFLVFDADNLLSKDYTMNMNDTFDAGYLVSTSFRDSKNFSSSLNAACSSIMFYRECLIIHHSRQILGLSTYISGTGYFVERKLLERLGGWPFESLTEDIEFACWCVKNSITIGYNQAAVFYDEQPNRMKESNKQRFRWCKGAHQCDHLYAKSLFKGIFEVKKRSFKDRLSCYEMLIHDCPLPIYSSLWVIIYFVTHMIFYFCGIEAREMFLGIALNTVLGELYAIFGLALMHALICTAKYWKYIKASWIKKIFAVIMFPFFAAVYLPIFFITVFAKKVEWSPIAHTESKTIEDLEKIN